MRHHSRFGSFLIITMLILGAGAHDAWASESFDADTPYPAPEWLIETITSAGQVGYNVSVAVDPVSGETYISYYEGATGDLKLARTGAPSGNCGPSNTWDCQVLDFAGVVGKFNSIAIGGAGPTASLYISYHDVTNGAIKVVEGSVTRATGVLSYTADTLETGDPAGGTFAGSRTSITIGADGIPHIGYQVDFGPSQAVKHAERVAPGAGNCGPGNGWQCESIHLDFNIGNYIDTAWGAGGITYIAFSVATDTDDYPMIATRISSAASCNVSSAWTCGPIRNTGNDTGEYLAFDIWSGVRNLVYRNATTESLEWARYVGPGLGNCGPGDDSYQCEWIDDIGPGGLPSGIAMEPDNNGYPVIAYQDVNSGFHDIKIARPLEAATWGPTANCGPLSPTSHFRTWYCETLEAGSLASAYAYGGLSMAMNADGEATVAYRQLFDPIVGAEEGRLKFATEDIEIFSDGFESGSTSAWSVSVP